VSCDADALSGRAFGRPLSGAGDLLTILRPSGGWATTIATLRSSRTTEEFYRYSHEPRTLMADSGPPVNLRPDDSAPFSSIIWAVSLFRPGQVESTQGSCAIRGNPLMAQRSERRMDSGLRA
jgi:hypothetical protein